MPAWTEADAREFARNAHESVGQLQPYTGAPYIAHPAEVVAVLVTVPHTPEMVAAAWLHDVREDVPWVTRAMLESKFGPVVAALVEQVSRVSRGVPGKSRAQRKALDREHFAGIEPDAKTIKLADTIVNVRTIVERNPRFARTYLPEKVEELEALRGGDAELWSQAARLVAEQLARLAQLPD